jgi:hypothetical protein
MASCDCFFSARRSAAPSMMKTMMNAKLDAAIFWNGGNCVKKPCRISADDPTAESIRYGRICSAVNRTATSCTAIGMMRKSRTINPIPPTPCSTPYVRCIHGAVQRCAA